MRLRLILIVWMTVRFKLQITNYKLQITNYKLRVTSYKLRVTSYELRVTSYELHCHKLNSSQKLYLKFNIKIIKLTDMPVLELEIKI